MAYKKKEYTKDQRDSIKRQAIAFWDASTIVMEPFIDRVNDYERLYRLLLPVKLQQKYDEQQDKSCLVPPDIYNNISSMRAHVSLQLFSTKPYVNISIDGQPNMRDDTTVKAEQVAQSMMDLANFDQQADKSIHQVLCCGRTAVYHQWHRRFERVVVRDPKTYQVKLDDFGMPTFRNEMVAEYAESIPIDIRRVRIDPKTNELSNMRILGYQSLENISDLFDYNQDFENYYDFNEDELKATSFDHSKYFEYVRGEITDYSGLGENRDDFSDKVAEVWKIRGLFAVPYGKKIVYEDLKVNIGNKTLLLALERNDLPIPGWEQFDFPAIEEEHGRFFTMGLIEPVMDLFIEKFLKRNQSLDETNRSVYTTYIADMAATAHLPETIEYIPDQILKIDTLATGGKSIKDVFGTIQRSSNAHDSFNQSNILTEEIQQTQKLNDYMQSTDPSRKETATAVDALSQGGQTTLKKLLLTLKNTYIAPSVKKQLILYNFYRGHEENVIYDQEGNPITINKGELLHFYKIDVDIASSMDRPSMVRRFVEMYPQFTVDPFIDQYEIRRIAIQLLKLPNPDKLLPPNQHLQMIIDRENIALGYGIEQPVSPFDRHQAHIESHVGYIDFLKSRGLDPTMTIAHLEQHQLILEKQTASIANSTKDRGGGSAGNSVQPEGAAIKLSKVGV